MPERCFYGFLTIFFFAVPLSRKRKAAHDRPIRKWNKPSYTAGKPGRMILSVRPDTLGQTYKIITSLPVVCPVSRFRQCPFSFWHYPFLRISLLKFSCPICLHFRLPPFSRLSVSRIRQSFPFWAQGNSGIGRECKVKPPVFCGNLQPCG